MAQFLHDPRRNNVGRVISGDVQLCPLAVDHAAIWEYLAECEGNDGKTRLTSTLLVFVEDGLVKLCLNDRQHSRTAWVSAETLTKALAGLDQQLRDDTCEWRRPRVGKSGR